MRHICTGWLNVHTDTRVLDDDHQGGLDSHAICYECLQVYRAQLEAAKKETP